MELVLVRHARPERIEDADGPADPGLTEIGHRQARAVAGYLALEHFDALYTSPMRRARETAAPLERLLGVEAQVRQGVREYDAEHASYIPSEELKQDPRAWREFLESEQATDRSEFVGEVADTLQAIAAAHRGQTVAVFCHGGVINAWAHTLLGTDQSLFFNPDYTSINRFRVASTGQRSLVSLNERAHLSHPDLRLSD